jgi:hypothetical protein
MLWPFYDETRCRAAPMLLVLAIDSESANVIRLARSILGFAQRAGVMPTWAVQAPLDREFARALLTGPTGFDVAIWGAESWTDRDIPSNYFRQTLRFHTQELSRRGFACHSLVSEGTAYLAHLPLLTSTGIVATAHISCGRNRRTDSPRGLGHGVWDLPMTHTLGRPRGLWSRPMAREIDRLVATSRASRWLVRLGNTCNSPAALRRLREFIARAGVLQRRGLLRVEPMSQPNSAARADFRSAA